MTSPRRLPTPASACALPGSTGSSRAATSRHCRRRDSPSPRWRSSLFADGDQSYDLIVLLAGTADVVEGYGQSGASVVASYGPAEFLGEIGMLTGQRAFLSAVATSAGRVLAVPLEELRRVMAQEPGLSDLILRTFLLRHSLLMSRGTGLTLIGSRFDADTRRLLEVLARNRLVWTWLDLEASPEAEQNPSGPGCPGRRSADHRRARRAGAEEPRQPRATGRLGHLR